MAETLDSQIDLVLGNVPIVPEEFDAAVVYEALLKVHQAIEILVDSYDTAGGTYVTIGNAQTISGVKTFSGGITLSDAVHLVLGTATGSIIAATTAQKLGFWGKTPIVQPAAALQAALVNSTGGGQDGTLQNVTGAGSLAAAASGAACNNNFTDIYALLTEIRTALVNAGLMKGSA